MRRFAVAVLCFSCGGTMREPTVDVVTLQPAPRSEPPTPPTQRREVDLGEIRIRATDQPTPDADIGGQLFESAQSMRNCWGARGARLTVDLVVAVSGNVVDAQVSGDNDDAARCVHNAFVGWRTFPSGEALHVTVTILGDPAPLPPPELGGGLPDSTCGSSAQPFDRGAAAVALGAVNLSSCATAGGAKGTGHISLTFGECGTVLAAVVDQPPFAGTPIGECIAGKFRSIRVPAFSGGPVKIGKSFVLR